MLVLDTDIMVDVQRGFQPALEWLAQMPESPAITVITVLELLRGCRNSREQQSVELLLARMPILYISEAACMRAVEYFRTFHLSPRDWHSGCPDSGNCDNARSDSL